MSEFEDFIDYGELIDDAMHIIVQKVLQKISKEGLPGDHHFFISFKTRFPGVSISKKLLDQYPDEMTIVLQYQYEDLIVNEDKFEVTLSFDNINEKLVIPFASLTAFADPSVKFGLQFRSVEDEFFEDSHEFEEEKPKKEIKNIENVVQLDQFRKKD